MTPNEKVPDRKYCPRCRRTRPRSKFDIELRRRDGLRSECRDCRGLDNGIGVRRSAPGVVKEEVGPCFKCGRKTLHKTVITSWGREVVRMCRSCREANAKLDPREADKEIW